MKRLGMVLLCLLIALTVVPAWTVSVNCTEGLEEIFQQKHRLSCGPEEVDLNDSMTADKIKTFDDSVSKTYDSMLKENDRDTLWPGLELKLESKNHYGYHDAFVKLLSLAKAYKKAGSKYFNNQQLKSDIISALEFLRDRGYNDTTPLAEAAKGNWYYWEISIPQSIVSLMFYMRDDLPRDLYESYISAMKHFIQAPNIANAGMAEATGANLAWKCNLWIKIGVINNEEQLVYDGIEFMNPLFKYAEELHARDGFYKDGSFIQHENVAYNGGYGSSHVSEVLQVVEFLAGTKYAFPQEKVNILGKWVVDGFLPLLCNGNMMDMVRGREVARQNSTDRVRGMSNLSVCFRVGQIVSDEYKKVILSEVRYQLENNDDVREAFMNGLTEDRRAQADEMMSNPEYADVSRPSMKIYNGMSRAVYTGEGFALGIAMFSDRIKTHEYHTTEHENKKGWFMSHGSSYLYTGDSTQFSRNYYPTVDPYMLPGITRAETERKTDEQGILNKEAFAGGTSLDGKYGSVGLHMIDWPDKNGESLEAWKSYFCFDNQVVALGLVDTKGVPAKTVIENRIVESGESIAYDGKTIKADNNENAVSEYVYLSGKNNTGYVLGKGTKAVLKTEKRSGAWSDISDKSYNSKEIKENEFMTLYTEHGANAKNQKYEYVLLPSASKRAVEQYDAAKEYEVLENSENAAGIVSLKNNAEMINFWKNGTNTVGSVTAEGACSVIVKEADGRLRISAADPTGKADRIRLKVNKKAGELLEKSEEIVKVHNDNDGIYIEINTSQNHIGVFEAVLESDTEFKTIETADGKAGLVLQGAAVFKDGGADMLYNGDRTSVYPENAEVRLINKDGSVYVPLRTLAMMYPIEVSAFENIIKVDYNGREVQLTEGGRVDFADRQAEWIESDGVMYVPLRVFAEELLGIEVKYAAPLVIVGSKDNLDRWSSAAWTAAIEELE